jgi:pyridoxal/pyridoxine/pyridoxamine kinase
MERHGGLRVVDPVMGDMGKLYQSMDAGMVKAMRELCAHAD